MSAPVINRAIELHDSYVAVLERIDDRVRLVLEPAYVHESPGIPGVDPGVGCLQTLELLFDSGSIAGVLTALPFDVSDGTLTVNTKVFSNLLPLPLSHVGTVEMNLLLKSNERAVIRSRSIAVGFEGLPEDYEEFPGVRS